MEVSESPRIEELRRRVERDPSSIAFAQLAEEYRRRGDLAEAIKVCRAGLVRHPAYLSAKVTLGRALQETRQYEEARAELEEVLRFAPDNLAAIRCLAEIHQRGGGGARRRYEESQDVPGEEAASAASPVAADPESPTPVPPMEPAAAEFESPTPVPPMEPAAAEFEGLTPVPPMEPAPTEPETLSVEMPQPAIVTDSIDPLPLDAPILDPPHEAPESEEWVALDVPMRAPLHEAPESEEWVPLDVPMRAPLEEAPESEEWVALDAPMQDPPQEAPGSEERMALDAPTQDPPHEGPQSEEWNPALQELEHWLAAIVADRSEYR